MTNNVNNNPSNNLNNKTKNNDNIPVITGNPIINLISNTAYGAVGGAISVAMTALPFVNKYVGVASTGMLPKAIGYGAVGGAVAGAVVPLTGLPMLAGIATGSLGALTAGSVALSFDADKEQTGLSSMIGGGVGFITGGLMAGTALTDFATGYVAKKLAPDAFRDTAVNTGIKLLGSSMMHLGLVMAVGVAGGLLASLPTLIAHTKEQKNQRKSN